MPARFRLLAAVQGEGGGGQGRAGRGDDAAVALVEPFRLDPGPAGRGLAAFQPQPEHLHGVRQRRCILQVAVHLVAAFGGAQVGQAGSGDQQVRRVRMIDGRADPPLGQGGSYVDCFAQPGRLDRLAKAGPGRDGRLGQVIGGVVALDPMGPAVVGHGGQQTITGRVVQLHEFERHGGSIVRPDITHTK